LLLDHVETDLFDIHGVGAMKLTESTILEGAPLAKPVNDRESFTKFNGFSMLCKRYSAGA
jgi:hypothetical protein